MFRSLFTSAAALVFALPGGTVGGSSASPAVQGAAPGSLVERRGANGLFHLSARLGAADLRMVVDTGATALVVSERDAARADLKPGGAIGTLQGADGPIAVRWTRAARLEIAGIVLHDVEVAVVPGPLATPLAGQEVLARLGTIAFTGDRLTISPPASR